MDKHPIVLNLDSGQLETLNEHVWGKNETEWLEELIGELVNEEDLTDWKYFVEDMKDSEWGNVLNDVDYHSDFDLHFLQ